MAASNPKNPVDVELKKVGQWLREAREEMHLSIRELAKLCGVSDTNIARMEAGNECTVTKLVQVAAPLGIPPGLLIDGALTISTPPRTKADQDALVSDDELYAVVSSAKEADFMATLFAVLDLADLLTVCTSRLLLSSSPAATLKGMEIPLLSLKAKLAEFIRAYGLDTSTTERAAVYNAILQQPLQKLRALGLLTRETVEEFLQHSKNADKILSQDLKEVSGQLDSDAVSNAPSEWSQLVARTLQVTTQWGAKTRLARDLGVSPQAVNQWLSGANAPSAETTLRLLQWVTAAEAKQKT